MKNFETFSKASSLHVVVFTMILMVLFWGCYKKRGCMDITAINYDEEAEKDSGTCEYVYGCTDPAALNYNPNATKSNNSCTYASTFELHINYSNPNSNNPIIGFDSVNSSTEIKIDFTRTFAGFPLPAPSADVNVVIDNVRIIDADNHNYKILNIQPFEWRNNEWEPDVEFSVQYDSIEDLAVALVLDASNSLGNDFENVKEYAKNFARNIFSNSESARIAIVDFGTTIRSSALFSTEGGVFSYIDGISKEQYTKLYNAIDEAIDILGPQQAEGKAMVIFTDGTDNYSTPPADNAGYLIDRLENDPNNIKINSFAIGLEGRGGVDRSALLQLVANSGSASFPNNVQELQDGFSRVSSSIANVYSITYVRNNLAIPTSTPKKIKFVISASRQ